MSRCTKSNKNAKVQICPQNHFRGEEGGWGFFFKIKFSHFVVIHTYYLTLLKKDFTSLGGGGRTLIPPYKLKNKPAD